MKQFLPFLLVFASFRASSQSDVTKVFSISPVLYDLGTKVLPNGDGFAVFGYQGGSSATNGDIFMLRLDKDGNEIGRHFYGLNNKTESIEKGIIPVGNDGWLLAGWQAQAPSYSRRGYLLRIDATGTVKWSKTLIGPNLSGLYFTALASLPTGGYLAAGLYNAELALVRLTEDGDIMWKESYAADVAQAIFVSEGGGNCFVATSHEILKIRTSNGQLAWIRDIELPVFGNPGGQISVSMEDIAPTGNGTFAVTGTALNDDVFNFEQAPYASLWTETGEILWANAFPANPDTGEGGGTANSLLYLPNQQNLMLTGEAAQGGINVTRIDMDGKALAVSNIPTPALCIFPVLLKHQGKYIATGGCFTDGMNTLFYRSAGNWLPSENLRPDDRAVSPLPDFTISPNPATTTIKLDYWSELGSEVCFQIINAAGQLVFEKNTNASIGKNAENFNVLNLPTGLYWLTAPQIGMRPIAWLKE